MADLPTPRSELMVVSYGERIFVMGGKEITAGDRYIDDGAVPHYLTEIIEISNFP